MANRARDRLAGRARLHQLLAAGDASRWHISRKAGVGIARRRTRGIVRNLDDSMSDRFRAAFRRNYAVARRTASDEIEILNVAVDSTSRRRGIGRSLICELIGKSPGTVFLEVRQSNIAARKLYHSLGFEVAGVRQDYYSQPMESAIVMKFHSC